MTRWLILALLVLIIGWYLSFTATRLDRLHHRVETSWANLDALLQKAEGARQQGCRSLEYTHQPWSSPGEEGLRSNWYEPRNPAASLADPTL